MEVGDALMKVRDAKLYRAKFATFEEYTESRGVSIRQAYRYMAAAETAKELKNVTNVSHDSDPINIEVIEGASENALNELAKTDPEKRAKVAAKAAKNNGGKLTAKAIKEAAAELDHKAKPIVDVEPVKKELPAPSDNYEGQPDIPDHYEASVTPPAPAETEKPMTPGLFETTIQLMEARIPAELKDRLKYVSVLQRATVRQMKYGKPAEGILSNLDAYTSKAA
jgi:hypothetical protein